MELVCRGGGDLHGVVFHVHSLPSRDGHAYSVFVHQFDLE